MFKLYGERKEFFQWDLNQKIIVEDSSITEVHFWNGIEECALVCEVYEENGQRLANVPNILLQERLSIRVYAYCGDCYTKEYKLYKVTPREKPADYVYTETEVKSYAKLEERIAKLEENSGGTISSDLYSNALKGAASGAAVALDVSPIEHILKIKATSDTADVSTAKVLRYGSNILDQDTPTGSSKYWEKQGEYWVGTNANYAGLSWGGYCVSKGQTITVSFDCDSVGKGSRCIITKDKPDCVGVRVKDSQLGRNIISYTATEDMNVFINFMDFGADGVYKIKNIMLCYGTNTEYEPYTEPTTYDISTGGAVEGVTSLYPITTLTSDTEGIVLDVEYNRDINKAFAELQNAVISLGGNI